MPICPGFKRRRLGLLLAFAALAVTAPGFLAWQHLFPATASEGWEVKVYMDNVPMVSALARDDSGALYFTREHKDPQGSLLKQLPDGTVVEVMGGLNKPDGLLRFRGGILISQEGGDYSVLWLHDGHAEKLFPGRNIEGIDSNSTHIFAIEDLKIDGRLLQHDPMTGETLSLRSGLVEAEGVAVCPDGRLFYSEKKKGWIKQYRPGAQDDPVAYPGLNAPGFLMCNTEGLWIAEDATHGSRLLLADSSSPPLVILSHLRSAQTVLSLGPGRLLVAEQGRNRILEITRTPHDAE